MDCTEIKINFFSLREAGEGSWRDQPLLGGGD
jgi:hypothetical protein